MLVHISKLYGIFLLVFIGITYDNAYGIRLRESARGLHRGDLRALLESGLETVLGGDRGAEPFGGGDAMSSTTTATGLTDHSKGGGHVLVDKDSLVKYDGDIMWYDEFFGCAKGYYTQSEGGR